MMTAAGFTRRCALIWSPLPMPAMRQRSIIRRAVRVVVPFPAGGGVDSAGRLLTAKSPKISANRS